MKELTGFEGHIILYCKNHYNGSDNTREDLEKIWAIRCGYSYEHSDNSSIIAIINALSSILFQNIDDKQRLLEDLHNHLLNYLYRNKNIVDMLISFYVGRIANIQIKEKLNNGKWITLVKLPKPQKRLFNRILRGNGRYEDYKLIKA